VLAYPIMGVLFPSATALAAKLLLTGSLFVLFGALSTITASVLQSIGKQRTALINASVSLILNLVILAVILLIWPVGGIYWVMLANLLFAVFYTVLNGFMLHKYLRFRNELLQTYLFPLLASAVMGAAAFGIYQLLFRLTRRPSIAVIIAILIAIPVYLIGYVVISRTTREEMLHYPMGTKIVRVLELLRVYR